MISFFLNKYWFSTAMFFQFPKPHFHPDSKFYIYHMLTEKSKSFLTCSWKGQLEKTRSWRVLTLKLNRKEWKWIVQIELGSDHWSRNSPTSVRNFELLRRFSILEKRFPSSLSAFQLKAFQILDFSKYFSN